MEWFRWLVDTSEFCRRGECGSGWADWLEVTLQVADLVTAAAFIAIPLMLYGVWRSRHAKGIAHSRVIILFAAFVFLSALVHVSLFLTFHWPAYRLFVCLKVMTAIAGAWAAVSLPVAVSEILALPDVFTTTKTLESVRNQQTRAEIELGVERELHHQTQLKLAVERELAIGLQKAFDEAKKIAGSLSEENQLKLQAVVDNANNLGPLVGQGDVPGPGTGGAGHPRQDG